MKPIAVFFTFAVAVGLASAAPSPAGKWTGRLDWTGVTFAPGGKAPTSEPIHALNLKADHTFVMKMTMTKFSRVVSGTWTVSGLDVTLVDTIRDGKTVAGKPYHFALSADGKSLVGLRASADSMGPVLRYKRV